MKISRPVLINTSLGVVIAAAVAGALAFTLPATASTDTDATQLTSAVQQGVVSSSISATGQIAAAREVAAGFTVSGTIATVDVALGATVTAGQQLATLDTTDLADTLAKAQKTLTTAKAERTSAQADVAAATDEQQLSSANSKLTQAQTSVDNATDAVTAAKADVASATLTSPIAGLVIAVPAVGDSAGSSAGGTASGFTIADVSAMTMTAAIAEADIADVAVGQAATVTFPALTDVEATATVTAIAPTATASNSVVTYATTITLDAIPEGLRLGQTAEVAITIESSAEDALYVPSAAITTSGDTSTVDVVEDDGTVSTVTVTLGVVGDQGTEVLTGLELGQTIVLGEVSNDTTTTDTGTTNQQGGTFPGGGTPPTGDFPAGGGRPE
jgi:macrolide-specific efflux system membrane fusion protein